MIVQCVIIPKKNYTFEEAEKKVEELGYNKKYRNKSLKDYKSSETISFYLFKQHPNSQFKKDSFRSKKINDVFLIVGDLKNKNNLCNKK